MAVTCRQMVCQVDYTAPLLVDENNMGADLTHTKHDWDVTTQSLGKNLLKLTWEEVHEYWPAFAVKTCFNSMLKWSVMCMGPPAFVEEVHMFVIHLTFNKMRCNSQQMQEISGRGKVHWVSDVGILWLVPVLSTGFSRQDKDKSQYCHQKTRDIIMTLTCMMNRVVYIFSFILTGQGHIGFVPTVSCDAFTHLPVQWLTGCILLHYVQITLKSQYVCSSVLLHLWILPWTDFGQFEKISLDLKLKNSTDFVKGNSNVSLLCIEIQRWQIHYLKTHYTALL